MSGMSYDWSRVEPHVSAEWETLTQFINRTGIAKGQAQRGLDYGRSLGLIDHRLEPEHHSRQRDQFRKKP